MRSLIVTAGTGDRHRDLARLMEAHVNEMARQVEGGIPCSDLSDLMPWDEMRIPHHCKFYIWRLVGDGIDRLIWIDTDTFMKRAITEDELPDVPFAAVEDIWQKVGMEGHKRKLLEHDRCIFKTYQQYFNAGVMVCRRDAIPVFDLAREIANTKFKRSKFYDQDHFNYAVWVTLGDGEKSTGWHALDRIYNVQEPYKPCPGAVVLHLLGPDRNHKRLEEYYEGKHQ
jgi:lipopolysaccharide biosynthesis glycosyltransferase